MARLTAELEQAQQARVHQAQQLAEARQRVQAVVSKEKGAAEKTETELKTLRMEVEESKERERQVDKILRFYIIVINKLYSFKLTIHS